MFNGREKREHPNQKSKKKRLEDLKDFDTKEELKDSTKTAYNQQKISKEITVIHPVSDPSDKA